MNAPQALSQLFDYEREALLHALRRDLQHEEARAISDPQWREFHLANARADKSLLQLLNPKRHATQRTLALMPPTILIAPAGTPLPTALTAQ